MRFEIRLTSYKLLHPCLFLACLALANGLLLTPEGSLLRVAAAMILLLLPGLAWAEVLFPTAGRLTRWSMGAGLGYALAMVVGLILHYIPGPVAFWHELVALNGLALVPALALFVAPRPIAGTHSGVGDPQNFVKLSVLVAILALAAFFCFTDLGYSEFQGDEIKAMAPAARALEGNQNALFLDRKKGPGEVLLPMVLWRLTGTINEGTARLPFAVAGLFAVLAAYLIGRRLAGEPAGLITAALLTLNGFRVGFARVVQFPIIVMWLSALALLCIWEWRASPQSRWAALAGVFLGTGLLAHFDMLVMVPVLACAALITVLAHKSDLAAPRILSFLRQLLLAAGLLLIIGALFFVPYSLDTQLGRTTAYLGNRIGADILNNGLGNFLSINIFYTSFYYLLITGILVLGFLAWTISCIRVVRRLPGSGYWLPAMVGLVAVALMVWPKMLRTSSLDAAIIPFAVMLLGAFLSPALTPYQRDVVVWLAISFLGYTFLLDDPRAHVYMIALPWIILAGLAAARLWELAGDRRRRLLFYAGSLLLVLSFGGYLAIAYLRQDLEFRVDWPSSRTAFFWAPPPYDKRSNISSYGFVHRRGWKGIGALYDAGQLVGDFDSNENPEATVWYTRGARATREEIAACDYQPEYYLIADDLVGRDQQSVSPDVLKLGYDAIGRIELPNGKGLTIYQIRPSTGNLGQIEVDSLERTFDRAATPARFLQSQYPSQPADVSLHGAVRLIGYDLDLRRATPGGRITVTLYWKALVDIPLDLHVFAQLESANGDPPGVWGQSNGTPACGLSPTHTWKAGYMVADRHTFTVKPDTPLGDYVILTGMYLPENGTRLDVRDADGNPIGNAVRLTTISIRR